MLVRLKGEFVMIKSIDLKPFKKPELFPAYVYNNEVKLYTLNATVSGGYEREFNAVKQAMIKAGIEFEPIPPCHIEELLEGLGAWYKAANPDIRGYAVVSQTCH